MKKINWTSDKILSLSAILISVGTLFTIIYQTNLMYKQQSASVLPYLEIGNSSPNIDTYSLVLVNNGIGPALINSIKVIKGDTVHLGDPISFYEKFIKPKDTMNNIYYSSMNEGRLIPAGKVIELVAIEKHKDNAISLRKWFGGEKNVIVEIEYSSVYEEKWVSSNRVNGKPHKLED